MKSTPTQQRPSWSAVREALLRYHAARKELEVLGILRTKRTIQSDLAEWFVADRLGLELHRSNVNPGYDAKDPSDRTYQIKGRVVSSLTSSTSWDFKPPVEGFDIFIGVLFNEDLEVIGVFQVARNDLLAMLQHTASSERLRYTKTFASRRGVSSLAFDHS